MAHPTIHFSHHVNRKKLTNTVDGLAYFVGIVGNGAVVPQILKAWGSQAPGLAISTWVLFTFISLIWLTYAILHKQRPLILAQTIGLTANILVVSGWMFNNILR